MPPILSVKAGRATRRGDTNWVDPEPAKGLLQLEPQEDLLMFSWTSREAGASDSEELILFPGDCEFLKVSQDASGRSYVLKFSSSDERNFFWFQDGSDARDRLNAYNINQLIQNPRFQPETDAAALPPAVEAPAAAAAPTTVPAPLATPAPSTSASAALAAQATPHPQRTADLSTLDSMRGRELETPAPANVHGEHQIGTPQPGSSSSSMALASSSSGVSSIDASVGAGAGVGLTLAGYAGLRGMAGLNLRAHPAAGLRGPLLLPGSTLGAGLGGATPSGAGAGQAAFSKEQVDALARLFQARGAGGAGGPVAEDARLTDILTSSNLTPIFTANPSLLTSLVPHLPPTLPLSSPPTAAEISQIVSSAQFREAVGGLDAALRTGGLTGLMPGLGLPARAGQGVGEFLEEVEKQGKEKKGDDEDRMDTD